MTQPFIHALAAVQSTVIGAGTRTRIWQYVAVPSSAKMHRTCQG
jgi:hypothetical protein